MADVTLKYKGATISELSESGSKTLETSGKYCEADILLEYVKSGSALPSSISKIDGGEFTLSNDTKCEAYDIATQLGTPAKGFVIWSDDLVSFETQTVKGLLTCAVNIFNFESASNTTRYGYYSYLQRQVNGSTYGAYATLSYADQPGKFTTSEKINYKVFDTYYIAGKKYKWLAWA